MNKKYVITGGAGFIGSGLIRALEQRGDAQIAVIDNLLTGYKKNLDGLSREVEFHHFDIRNYDAIAPVIAGADTVFHLAAIPSVPKSIADPLPSHDVNINGTFSVLRAAKDGSNLIRRQKEPEEIFVDEVNQLRNPTNGGVVILRMALHV